MSRVHVATPTTGEVRVEHAQFLQWLMLHQAGHDLLMYMVEGRPIPDSRCKIVRRFLADPAAEYLFMIDDDQWPSEGKDGELFFNPLDLIEQDLDVVTFPSPTVRYSRPDGPVVWYPAVVMPDTPLIRSRWIASSAIIIARRVLEHPDLRVPFANTFKPDGTLCFSEDVDFAMKADAAGFTMYVAMDRPLHHAKTLDLLVLWRALHQDSHPATGGDSLSLPKAEVADAASAGKG